MERLVLATLPLFLAFSHHISPVLALPSSQQAAVNWAYEGERCGPAFDNATCYGICCSKAGYCGRTEAFCSVPDNCQAGFGWCDSYITPKGLDVSRGPRSYSDSIPLRVDKCTLPHTLALTFDDGPTNYTNDILDILKKHGARATFFLAGVNNGHGQLDVAWRATVVRMILEGHQIGSHTWSHPNLNNLSSADRKLQMYKTERAIINIIGKMPNFMRPPMVACGDACMKDMRELGYHVVDWEVESGDWYDPRPPVEETTARIENEMLKRENMILIQHDTSGNAVDVLASVLDKMPASWKAIPLIECIGHSLDDAFQYPKWIEYNGTTYPDGCLVSGNDFCALASPFATKLECERIAGAYNIDAIACAEKLLPTSPLSIPAKEHCRRMRKIADAVDDFCKKCDDEADCNGNNLKFKLK